MKVFRKFWIAKSMHSRKVHTPKKGAWMEWMEWWLLVIVYNLWKLQLLWLDTWTCCNSNDHWSWWWWWWWSSRALAPALKTARFTLNLFSWIYPSIFLFAEVPKNRQHNLPTFPLVDKPQHLIFNASKKWWWWWQWSLRLMMLINYDNLDEWSCQPITHCLIHVW